MYLSVSQAMLKDLKKYSCAECGNGILAGYDLGIFRTDDVVEKVGTLAHLAKSHR